MNKPTAIYVRVSTQGQRPDSQLTELEDYCRRRGWDKLAYFMEKESGAKTSRPELDRMLSDVRAGRIERVVAFKLDRLGRSVSHLALMMDELIRLRVPLVCTSQGIDTSEDNAAGRLQADIIAAMAQFERSLIRERVQAGLAAARQRGVRLGRPPVLQQRAAEVKGLRATGMTFRAIADRLGMKVSSVHKSLGLAS